MRAPLRIGSRRPRRHSRRRAGLLNCFVGTNENPAVAGDVAHVASEVIRVLKAAKALPGATVTLEQGLSTAASSGTPISGKFEVEDGHRGQDRLRKTRLVRIAFMKWITRSNIKVDRVACPWLIKRFVDDGAEFLFVPETELLSAARREHATPFDASRLAEVTLNHRGDRCTFEAILEDFHLADPVLVRLGRIVRAADVKGQEHVAPEGPGLRAIAEGFAALGLPDQERLTHQFPVYDALYEYVRARAGEDTLATS